MNTIISSFASSGIWPALPITGYLLFWVSHIHSSLKSFSPLTSFALLTMAGITFWSVPMAVAAWIGIFSGVVFGILGWSVTLAFCWLLAWGKADMKTCFSRFSVSDGLLGLVLFISAVCYFYNPAESIVGGRDMGVYSNHGIYIAHHGRLDIPPPWENAEDTILANVSENFQGFSPLNGSMTVQFAHLYPVWLAQTFCSFDFQGLIRFNGIMALLSICILYGVGRLLMPERYAIAAVFIIALNPGQLWVTHMTLTEIFAQVSIWSGLLILCYALKTEDSRFAMWAGIILGLSLWIRIDSFLLIPFFFLSHLMYRIATRNDGSQREHIWLSFYKSGLLMFLAGALFNVFTTLPYIIGISSQLRLADRLMIATAVLLLLIVPKIQDYIQRFLRYRATFVVLAGIVSLLTIYAYGIRPRVQPFNISFMPNGVSMRDYRENSLVNIAKYLSPLIVFSAPIGLLVMYWNIFKKKTDHHLVAAVLISIGMSIAYLWNPSIVPDHFWAIRRFIPVSIPGFVLFAGIGISWLLGRYIPRFGRYVAVGLLIFFVVFLVKADLLQMSVQEDEGIYDQLKGLAEKLPENKTILSDNNGTWAIWETPMYIAFDRKVIPLDIDQNPGRQIAQMWLSHKNNPNDTRYLAYETSKDLGGLKIKSMKEVELKMSFLEHSYDHLPEKTNEGAWDVQIFEVSSVVDNFMGYQLGGKPYDGVDESGFYNSEDNGRWTNGSGSLTIPIKPGYRPDSLRVNLASTGPLGTTLNIVANHIELLKKKLPAAGWSGVMSLGQVPINDELEIEVNSDRFTPAKILPNNSDSRTLGVMVKSVILLGNKDLISGRPLGDSGYHSMLRIDRLDTQKPIGSDKGISFELTVLNTGNIPWLSFSELGSYRGAVRVGILWRSKSDSLKPVLEQRAELPGILQPGEESRFSISLVPLDGRGKRLSPGEYEIWVGMLQEGVVWFYTKGDTLVKIPIEVENN